jgi:hypothetical protein
MNNTLSFENIDCFPMGINIASVNYYSTQWTFKNPWEESGGCCWPADAKVDANGNLLQASNDITSVYWIAGRNLLYRVDGYYPAGTYILRASGSGKISMSFDTGPTKVVNVPTPPEGVPFPISNPSPGGIQLTIVETDSTDVVRDISFMLQEFDQEDPAMAPSPFTPTFTNALKDMSVIRFMDFGQTNGNNIVHWSDRSTKSSISQARTIRRTWDISTVKLAPASKYTGSYGIELTTSEPHGLTTGQVVTIDGLKGIINVTNPNDKSFVLQRNLTQVYFPKNVEVTSPTTFVINAHGGGIDSLRGDVMSSISPDASANLVELTLKPGVAYEYMLELSDEVNADPWICVPHLATDDYVRELANLIAASPLTSSNMTLYIELSNEVWNLMFSQTHHAYAMQRMLDLRSSSEYYGRRSREVFDIFEEEFVKYDVENVPTLHRVLASQSVNTWVTEQAIIGAGGKGSFDSVAIAPYFSAHPKDVFALSTDGKSVTGVTVDDVLELCVDDINDGNRKSIIAQKAMADKYGGKLVAYEGGQHLGGQGPDPRGGRIENDVDYQNLMIAANRDRRMHNVYQAYFQQWGELNPGGVFAHFSFIGLPSKWGSWGAKETYFHDDTVDDSPKWMSVDGIANHCSRK